jgi:hypothetical protein
MSGRWRRGLTPSRLTGSLNQVEQTAWLDAHARKCNDNVEDAQWRGREGSLDRGYLALPFYDVAIDVLASGPHLGPQLVNNGCASLERLDVGNRDEGAGLCPSLSRGATHAGCTADDQNGSGAKPVGVDGWLVWLHVTVCCGLQPWLADSPWDEAK